MSDVPDDPRSNFKICNICRVVINTSKNTSNARTHLKSKHPREFLKAEDAENVDSFDSDADSILNESTSSAALESNDTPNEFWQENEKSSPSTGTSEQVIVSRWNS